jgi:hypothetical protein
LLYNKGFKGLKSRRPLENKEGLITCLKEAKSSLKAGK